MFKSKCECCDSQKKIVAMLEEHKSAHTREHILVVAGLVIVAALLVINVWI